ncbi:MAG TPA: LytTR family DNA-binding domain-containing protein [Opitutaceae bacterium]|nr:LytTR family DNA-binding domain-containing protein [Opitutaceae bacterium]
MTPLRVLIVDDEPLARERLRAWLRDEPSFEIAGECGSGTEAIATLRSTPLDLILLDVEMPGCNGLQVLSELPAEDRPAVIFVTAHERFALDAFEVQAIDYLLKPFDRERFQTALRRAEEHLRARRAGKLEDKLESLLADATGPGKKPERLTVKANGRLVFLKPDDIIWIEAADNYIILHLASGRLMLRETLTAIEERLGAATFARVNRSALVNLDQIKELQPTFHGDYVVVLRNGTKVPLSRSLRGQFGKFAGEA